LRVNILDVGASELACRGDVCLIYKYDVATERHLSQYDAIWPLRDGVKVYYEDVNDLIAKLRQYEADVAVLVHSLEHMDCPYAVLRTLAEMRVREVHVYVPNSQRNDADWKDPTHVYSFTSPSLQHLIERAMTNYRVSVEEVMDGMDLHAIARLR